MSDVQHKLDPDSPYRLIAVDLDAQTMAARTPEIDHERQVAIFDLLEENYFRPIDEVEGPYRLYLRLVERRLAFDIRDGEDREVKAVILALSPFRRIIKDYQDVCETYYAAIRTATRSQIEAIDMGRRGLHNDGSDLLRERLTGKIDIDDLTARRLFTLLFTLHVRL